MPQSKCSAQAEASQNCVPVRRLIAGSLPKNAAGTLAGTLLRLCGCRRSGWRDGETAVQASQSGQAFVSRSSGKVCEQENLMTWAASYPPLQRTQGRGTHSRGHARQNQRPGHPSHPVIWYLRHQRVGHPAPHLLQTPASLKAWAIRLGFGGTFGPATHCNRSLARLSVRSGAKLSKLLLNDRIVRLFRDRFRRALLFPERSLAPCLYGSLQPVLNEVPQ